MLKNYIQNRVLREIIEWSLTILTAIILGMLFSRFVAGTANISGRSMEPTLQHNDIIFLNKFVYRFASPKKNDIIVFPYETDPKKKYIKRVIGTPGDIIDYADGCILVNSEKLDDAFSGGYTSPGNIKYPLTVPDDHYFALGDNRNDSEDSRFTEVGCIPVKKIIGKAFLRILPINKINLIR